MANRDKQGVKPARSDRSTGEQEFSVERPDGAVALWSQVVTSLKQGGFEQAGQAYLQLSRVIRDKRTGQLVRGETDDSGWAGLRDLAREAQTMLEPVIKAAQLLAELPAPAPEQKAPAASTAKPQAVQKPASKPASPKSRANGSTAAPTKSKAHRPTPKKSTPNRKPNSRAASRSKPST